ncbi:MAG: hypothetical protein ACI9N9_002366 [Enterobacterales bacterium]|jgi:hypothetical protein
MTIETVKIQGNKWLVNGAMEVPNAGGNSDYHEIQEWISEGNTPDPEFTDAEIAANTQQVINQVNLAYLARTDWYVIRKADSGEAVPTEVTDARAEARLSIVE